MGRAIATMHKAGRTDADEHDLLAALKDLLGLDRRWPHADLGVVASVGDGNVQKGVLGQLVAVRGSVLA